MTIHHITQRHKDTLLLSLLLSLSVKVVVVVVDVVVVVVVVVFVAVFVVDDVLAVTHRRYLYIARGGCCCCRLFSPFPQSMITPYE